MKEFRLLVVKEFGEEVEFGKLIFFCDCCERYLWNVDFFGIGFLCLFLLCCCLCGGSWK